MAHLQLPRFLFLLSKILEIVLQESIASNVSFI